MTTTKLSEIKQELQNLSPKELIEICLRLARYKKENKELLAYLLFKSHDVDAYAEYIKANMRESFKDINTSNSYLAKKTLRKILRQANKHVKYTSDAHTEVEVLIYFCSLLKMSGININKSKALYNIYFQQLKKIKAALSTLHEDVQYDFNKRVEDL